MHAVQVAETRNVDPVGSSSDGAAVEEAGHAAGSARPGVMVHQITPQAVAGIAQAIGETIAARAQQDACGLNGGRAQEYDAGFELEFLHRDRVDHTNPTCAIALR